MISILAGALALVLAQQTDTTVAARADGRLALDAFNGSVAVRTWDREAVRVQAAHDSRVRVRVAARGGNVTVESEARAGMPGSVRYEITVPRRYGVALEGINLVATVDGVSGSVSVENVEGTITIRNVTGSVAVESVSGSVTVDNVRGRVTASSVNQGLRITRVIGDIAAETTNGSIVIEGADATRVDAGTVNGIVTYLGAIRDGGSYSLYTHNGIVTMGIPESANATVSVSTRNGSIQSAFSVPVRTGAANRVSFTSGNGSARIELASYNGSINLVRPRAR